MSSPTVASRQSGSLLPLVALLVVATGGLTLMLGRLGATAAVHAQARTAADAAALAGASEGRVAAARLATENGGLLVSFVTDGADVEVRVEVAGVVATARARRLLAATCEQGAGAHRVHFSVCPREERR